MDEECLQSKMEAEDKHASNPSSTALASVPKTSMFAKKIGFVIPKNKLSGSLVPLSRSTRKVDADVANEEATNQVQRKTKWGPDPSLDNTVRKGRALAYQTRINQISQQLTVGKDNEDSLSTSEFQYEKTSDHLLSKEESEVLELERREIIGEILKLNPTYKAPADYKPILKEAKVPIPIKEYPGYNFIGLVFGSASDTHKRLEKETGAKIQVYGTKADTGLKVQVTPTDGKEIEDAYEDLYIHVSADTFEKIDAAVSLIELLVTPVSVNAASSSTTSNAVSDDKVNAQSSQSQPSSMVGPTPINQGTPEPYPGSLPPHPQSQFPQYSQPWFSAGPTNSSAPLANNTVQISSSPFNLTNIPSLFGPPPNLSPSFSPILPNPPNFHSRPQPPSYVQQTPPHNIRPIISTLPQSAPLTASFSDRPLNPQIFPSHGQNMVISGASQGNNPSNMFFSPPSQAAMTSQQFRPPMPNVFSGNGRNFDPIKPMSGLIQRPQQPSSSDFTFLPQRPPNSASPQFWQNNQPPHHHNVRPIQSGPQSPFSRHMGPDFQRPQISHTNFVGSQTGPLMPARPLILPHMQQQRNFIPPHPFNHSSGPFPHGPGAIHPQRPSMPHQHFGNNNHGRPFSSSSSVRQTYDPFSSTSAAFSSNPQMGDNAVRVHGESDPEYDDLMASVGVK